MIKFDVFLNNGSKKNTSKQEKTRVTINKPVYLGLPILEISKIVIYEFSYDYLKPKQGEKVKLCYIGTDSLIHYIKEKYITQIMKKILKRDLIL